jgi:WD40 repeat protein/Flp pilus assembly protein TadD
VEHGDEPLVAGALVHQVVEREVHRRGLRPAWPTSSIGPPPGTAVKGRAPARPHEPICFAETYQDTNALSMSPDGRLLACQHGDDGLILLDVLAGVPRPLIRSNEVLAACFSQDGQSLVYFPLYGGVSLWNVSHHQEVASLAHPWTGGLPSATFSADGNTFATADKRSHTIRIWNLAGSGEKVFTSGHDGGVPCAEFSPDGKVLATGSKDRLVKLWDAATGRLLGTLPRFESSIQRLAFSPDGRLLATGQFGPTSQPVQIWNLATLQAFTLADDELGQAAYGIAFSPDGKFLAACGNGLTLWRVAEGDKDARNPAGRSFKRIAHLPGRRSLCLCISPDSKALAWVDHNSLACLWDLAQGREIHFPGPPLGSPAWGGIEFFRDSDHLTLHRAIGVVETWDIRTVRRVFSWRRGAAIVVSPANPWVLGPDRILWSTQTGSSVFALPLESGVSWSDALSPYGEHLATGQVDGGLVIWNVPGIQAQLAKIGLEWRGDARPKQQQPDPQSYVPATPLEREHQVSHYSNLARRLAWVGRLAEAEDVYREALILVPHDPVLHENFGKFLEDRARYGEAEAEFDEAIRLQPEHGRFWVLRGWAYADRGQWDKASADFIKAAQCTEPHGEAWYSRAMLHLRDGDLDGYRSMCSEVLERFGAGATWTCTLSPESGADPDRIVSLAEGLLAKSSRDHWHVNQLGAALYRAGRFEDAVTRLTEATELSCHPYRTNMLHTWSYLAMAHHRLGHADEARRWLDRAVQGTQEALKSPAEPPAKSGNADGVIPPNWDRRLTLGLLRREAEQLTQAPGTKPRK